MKRQKLTLLYTLAVLVLSASVGFVKDTPMTKYKCMIQMRDYSGEGAYVVVSLLDPEGAYEKTLYVQGDDDEWYSYVDAWWEFYGKKRPSLDGITGATLSGGERSVCYLTIATEKLDAGYTMRFESSVEDQAYHKEDVSVPFQSKEFLKGAFEGSGFIRSVRIVPQF